MRCAAVFTLAFSLACGGYLYSQRIDKRVKKLEKIIVLISRIKTEIEFSADSIENIFSGLNDEGFSSLPFVSRCCEIIKEGAAFHEGWKKAVNENENVYSLKNEDIQLLLSFGSGLGTTDLSGQLQHCELHKMLLEEKLRGAVNDKKTLSKPARGIGFASGLAVLIIFM